MHSLLIDKTAQGMANHPYQLQCNQRWVSVALMARPRAGCRRHEYALETGNIRI